jgi:hypothetical protein
MIKASQRESLTYLLVHFVRGVASETLFFVSISSYSVDLCQKNVRGRRKGEGGKGSILQFWRKFNSNNEIFLFRIDPPHLA